MITLLIKNEYGNYFKNNLNIMILVEKIEYFTKNKNIKLKGFETRINLPELVFMKIKKTLLQ